MAEPPDSLLQTFLAGPDFGCPVCRYNLRDLHTDLCPECGTLLRLQVGAVEPSQNAVIAGLIGLAAGGGFSGLLIIYLLIQLLIDRFHPSFFNFATLTVIPFLIEGLLTLAWLRNWRRIRRLPSGLKALLATGCWALSLLNLIIFSIYIK